MIYSGVLIGFFGFGVWSHHMFAAGMGPVADAFFAISTMLIAIPTGVKIFNWLATMWGGTIRATVPFHYAAGLVALFTIGGLSGVIHAPSPVGLLGSGFGCFRSPGTAVLPLRYGPPAGADPWDGRTLEWRPSSPPPPHDFDEIPPVYSRDSFWREKYGDSRGRKPTPRPAAPDPHGIHMPAPSHWPIVIALGIVVAAVGALTSLALVLIGAAVLVGGSFAFALEHHRNPAHVRQEGGLGVDHRNLAMWVFLGSECFLFGTLIATYMAYKGRSVVGPHPHEILNLPITTLSTFDLLLSSLLMVLALAAVRRGDRFQSRLWLAGTAFFGLIFLGFQAYEFTSFVHEGLTLQTNLFNSTCL